MAGDVVDLIMSDHRELEKIFATLLDEPDKRAGLLPVMTTLLTAHSRAEESEVYPAATDAGIGDDVEHSQKEHLEADQLAKKLCETDPDSAEFVPALQALVDAVTHHVKEEEESVLPGIRSGLDDARRAELGQAFLDARAQHLGQQPADITRDQLQQQAANAGVSGTSSMSKSELESTLADEAES